MLLEHFDDINVEIRVSLLFDLICESEFRFSAKDEKRNKQRENLCVHVWCSQSQSAFVLHPKIPPETKKIQIPEWKLSERRRDFGQKKKERKKTGIRELEPFEIMTVFCRFHQINQRKTCSIHHFASNKQCHCKCFPNNINKSENKRQFCCSFHCRCHRN